MRTYTQHIRSHTCALAQSDQIRTRSLTYENFQLVFMIFLCLLCCLKFYLEMPYLSWRWRNFLTEKPVLFHLFLKKATSYQWKNYLLEHLWHFILRCAFQILTSQIQRIPCHGIMEMHESFRDASDSIKTLASYTTLKSSLPVYCVGFYFTSRVSIWPLQRALLF